MPTSLLTESIPFQENPLYETIISDLLDQGYSICDTFLDDDLTSNLREELHHLFHQSELKKAAIGNKTNESI
jgi:SM-20-related protein